MNIEEFFSAPTPEVSIESLFPELQYKGMSIMEYNEKIENGELIKKNLHADDLKFATEYPEHPLSFHNKGRRMFAADHLFDLLVIQKKQISPEQFTILHEALLDCCAAVRAVIAQTLGNLVDIESLPFLTQLVEIEHESKLVLNSANEAINVIKGELKDEDRHYIIGRIVYA